MKDVKMFQVKGKYQAIYLALEKGRIAEWLKARAIEDRIYFAAEKARLASEVVYHATDAVAEKAEVALCDAEAAYDNALEEFVRRSRSGITYEFIKQSATDAKQVLDIARDTYKTACKIASDASEAYHAVLSDNLLITSKRVTVS